MGRVFDEADYRRRLQTIEETPVDPTWSDMAAGREIQTEKARALAQARREMVKAIEAEMERARDNAVLPLEVDEIVTGSEGDRLVKVP